MRAPTRHEVAVYFGLSDDEPLAESWEEDAPRWQNVAALSAVLLLFLIPGLALLAISGESLTPWHVLEYLGRGILFISLIYWLFAAIRWMLRTASRIRN